MYNLIEMQNYLKTLSKEQLIQVLKSGSAPQYMVISRLNEIKNQNADQARKEATDDTKTVTQEVINAVGVPQGGIAQLAGAMNAQTDNTQNTGVMQMAEGGVVKMQRAGLAGGTISAIAHLKVNHPKLYETYKDDPEELALIAAEKFKKDMETAEDAELTGLEQLETPRTNFQKIMDFASYSPLKGRKNMEKIESKAAERDLQARVDTANALRRRNQFYVGEDPIFNDGGFSEQLKGSVIPVPLADADPLKFTPPNNLGGPSVATDRPLNTDNVSQLELGPALPKVSSNNFAPVVPNMTKPDMGQRPDMSEAKADPDYDATSMYELRQALSDPSTYGITDTMDFLTDDDVGIPAEMRGYNALLTKEDKKRLRATVDNPLEFPKYAKSMNETFFPQGGTDEDEVKRNKALTDLNRRALDYYRTDTYQPPSEVYPFLLGGDPRAIAKFQGESPEEVQAVSDLLYNEATKDEAAKEQEFFTADDNLQQSVFDDAIAEQAKATARARLYDSPYLVQLMRKAENQIASKKFDAENEGVGSEPVDFESIDKATEEKNRQEAAEQQANDILEQLKLDSEKTSAAASKADLSLSEYIKGLDKDRESLANGLRLQGWAQSL